MESYPDSSGRKCEGAEIDQRNGSDFAPSPIMSPITSKLLEAAAELEIARPAILHNDAEQETLKEFVRTYREWIVQEHGVSGSPQIRMEQAHLLLYVMVSASTLDEALKLLVRFSGLVMNGRGLNQLRDEGWGLTLIFKEPVRPGIEGEISSLWLLSMILCELEFLVGDSLRGITGYIPNLSCLPESSATLLFDHSLIHEAPELALVLPKSHLRRAVVARAADIPAFFEKLLPTTIGAKSDSATLCSLVEGMIKNDRLRNAKEPSDLSSVAVRLGYSPATIRRRLTAEGTSFREIRDRALVDLAKCWLKETGQSIEDIAERLGFSDGFAFRRAFRRCNDVSPVAYRRQLSDFELKDE